MGQPKQLLSWDGQTLIEYQLTKLRELGHPVCVVLGAKAEKIGWDIKKHNVKIVINENWKNGMGTSVSAGINQVLSDFPQSEAVLYTLIDQPLVTINHLQKLMDSFTPGQEQIVASRSENGWLGVPALYDAVYFTELSNLDGEHGAKSIIKKYISKVIPVEAGDMLEDMDTMESYHRLLTKYSHQNLSY